MALTQDNKYVSIWQTNNKYSHDPKPAPNNHKPPPTGKHAMGDQGDAYFEDSMEEPPLLNNLSTPTHCGPTLFYASQVPLQMRGSPPMSPSGPPSPGSPGSPSSAASESGMANSAVPNEWPENSVSSIATALPDLEMGVMGETSSLQWVKDKDKDLREGGEDPELPEGTYPGPSDPADSEGTLPLLPPVSHPMTVPMKLLAKY